MIINELCFYIYLQKDNIRLDFDRLTEHLVPPLDRYKVLFMPVVGGAHNSYVIHIKVLPSLTNVVHVVQLNKFEKCYSSLSGKSVKVIILYWIYNYICIVELA